jgi:uncharacterized membrane protein (UPF0127 family)
MKLSQASKRDLFALRECRLALAAIGFLVPSGADGSPPPSLPTATVIIDSDHGPVTFRAEIAADSASQQRGLMYRKRMSANAGMLFDFHRPQYENFWMKDTVLSLDLIFIREDGTISSIAPNAVPFSEVTIPSAEPVRAVLEINGGRAAQLGIEPGQHVHNAIFGAVPHSQK